MKPYDFPPASCVEFSFSEVIVKEKAFEFVETKSCRSAFSLPGPGVACMLSFYADSVFVF